jgi:hypothetical protein
MNELVAVSKEEFAEIVKILVKCFLELNTIRARDGVPYTRYGISDVNPEDFSNLIDSIDEKVTRLTDHSAHCHPLLYK